MRTQMYIDGKWVDTLEPATFNVINPATEETIHILQSGCSKDVELAVQAARRAFDKDGWPQTTGKQRAVYLRSIALLINNNLEELAKLEVLDNGKPLAEARGDIADAAGCFNYYAGLAEKLDENNEIDLDLSDDRFHSLVINEPVGVVGAIIPWNYPLLMAAWKIAPALAAGCTVVLKPAENTSLTALELAAIVDEVGLPAGVLNIVTGQGRKVGQAIIEHPGVDKLAFTGSGGVGSAIMAEAAKSIKRVSLELGGKSPLIVFEDSDIDAAIEWIMFGIFWNKGEVCSATSRVLVHESIYEKLLNRLVEETKKITIGNGMDDGILLGPLVSKNQLDAVSSAVNRAKEAGVRILTGGERSKEFSKGYFFEPTILVDVPLDSEAWNEEFFGPVVCVRPFSTESEAVSISNDSKYGLAAAVMTKDDVRAKRVAKALRAGIVWVNCSQPTFTEAPWGGFKQSGIGRELGPWGLNAYLEPKQITSYVSEDPWGWYLK
ncbi:aldehyde dehydrogenase family protein [Acinetobacter lactucae]|uniref:aldehyde dehydrogenase family protein n=1 Tax=Acinetobacter lactucae TaxID=1785128 RepID=UPI0015F3BBFE|nr:aldehyde dehydrogenase family protein [Acinetobacter lactucae]MDV7473226.1 aldehyde dehydrogenase family protein [Acinetobacter baumannii]